MKHLSSSELARECGVSKDLLRYYERIGVISRPARTDSRYRRYPASTVPEVKSIRRALQLGFSLHELAQMKRLRDSGQPPCKDVRRMAARRLESVVLQIEELQALKSDLTELLRDWDARLSHVEEGEPAGLLTTLGREQMPGS